jgi:hypothetical protein
VALYIVLNGHTRVVRGKSPEVSALSRQDPKQPLIASK